MVKVYAARTLPVNPADAPFPLKRNLLWTALQQKIRNAPDFVPAMKECTVVKDEYNVVLRDCVLQLPNKKMKIMREEVTSHGNQWIVFRQSDGSTTTNILSNGAEINDQDLHLSYVFEWDYPDVEEGTPEHNEAIEMTGMMALMGVKGSITQARQLVLEGIIRDST